MPISKSGKLYFSPAQIETARACSALEYARSVGYELVRHSATAYHLKEHDSMVFKSDGQWFWNSRGLKGRAIEFIMCYEQRSFLVAVHMLLSRSAAAPNASLLPPAPPPEEKPFELPEKSPTFKRLFSYLCKTRMLDGEIVKELVRQGRIYESIRKYICRNTGEVRTAHNVVFVGLDEEGQPRSAFQRGTTAIAFKGDVYGSQKQYAFRCPGREGATTVAVFEASIDAISHATLAKLRGEDWLDRDRIDLGGLSALALLHYLETHTKVNHIELCLDNDKWGIIGADRLIAELQQHGYDAEHGYTVQISLPPTEYGGKDWNNYLVAVRRGRGNKITGGN